MNTLNKAQTNLLRRKSGGIIARCAACVDLPALWDGEVEDNGRALTEVGVRLTYTCRGGWTRMVFMHTQLQRGMQSEPVADSRCVTDHLGGSILVAVQL